MANGLATNSPLLVIVGETASGKSALALEMARRFDGEIICADSWTVRQHMNIGTAKPSAEELAEIPHHLVDIVDVDEDFSAAEFKKLALSKIEEITARGKLPILCGGTGLYIDGVIFDYSFLSAGPDGQREELNKLTIEELLAQIEAEGIELGDVDVRNKRRLIRLIETNGKRPERTSTIRQNSCVLGTKCTREEIDARIASRVDKMIANGLESEVRCLSDKYGWDVEGMQGVGYRQWREYFAGIEPIERTKERIIKATRELAKRQRTWFAKNGNVNWLDNPVNLEEAEAIVTTFFAQQLH